MSTPNPDEWVLEACVTCGGLVFVKYDEDGTPTYKPTIPLSDEALAKLREMHDLMEKVSPPLFPLPDMDFELKGPEERCPGKPPIERGPGEVDFDAS